MLQLPAGCSWASYPWSPSPPAIEEVDAVVSTIGGSVADPSADSAGNINIIEAAVKKGVKKFVLVRATAHSTKLRPPFLGRRCGSVCPAER